MTVFFLLFAAAASTATAYTPVSDVSSHALLSKDIDIIASALSAGDVISGKQPTNPSTHLTSTL